MYHSDWGAVFTDHANMGRLEFQTRETGKVVIEFYNFPLYMYGSKNWAFSTPRPELKVMESAEMHFLRHSLRYMFICQRIQQYAVHYKYVL
jgi:hypothetical protein